MRDYAKLVKALRHCIITIPCDVCPYYSHGDKPSKECSTMNFSAADAIEELLAELVTLRNQLPTWISVEERLPESGERVLIMFKPLEGEENISIGWLTKSGFDCYDDSVYFFRSVTHWMPLPAPPKEVE
jgi:hypothetical protein